MVAAPAKARPQARRADPALVFPQMVFATLVAKRDVRFASAGQRTQLQVEVPLTPV